MLRLLAEVSVPLVAAVGLAGAARRGARCRRDHPRRRSGDATLTTDTGVGRNAAMLTGLVSVACVGGIAYVLLA